ncbi:MAG: YIP1 family protein [Candidatus Aenigmatarchaeota archaeon]
MFDYFKNPSKAVEKIEEETSLTKMKSSLGALVLASVIFTANSALGMKILNEMSLEITGPEIVVEVLEMSTVNLAVGTFFLIFLGGLFFGYIVRTVMNTLGGDGKYWDGLTTVSYPVLSASIGIILAMASSYIPVIGPVLAFIFTAVFFAVAYASMFRLAKEMFDVGMIEAFVGVTVILTAGLIGFYGGILVVPQGILAVLPA